MKYLVFLEKPSVTPVLVERSVEALNMREAIEEAKKILNGGRAYVIPDIGVWISDTP